MLVGIIIPRVLGSLLEARYTSSEGMDVSRCLNAYILRINCQT